MLGADMHHRTQDFRNVFVAVLADLNCHGYRQRRTGSIASGTGAMKLLATNWRFSSGDRVIVCTAGKFGERWVEMTPALMGSTSLFWKPVRKKRVRPETLEEALAANPEGQRRIRPGVGDFGPVRHTIFASWARPKKTGAIFTVDAITARIMPLEIDAWEFLTYRDRGSQKAFMVPPGSAFLSISPKAWSHVETAKLPRLLFQPEAREKVRGERRIGLDRVHCADARPE